MFLGKFETNWTFNFLIKSGTCIFYSLQEESQDAQLRDQQAARCGMEVTDRGGEETVS